MKATCSLVRSLAPSPEGAPPGGRLGSHVSQCLSCQAELARYNRLRRQLGLLADVVELVPPLLVAAVESEIGAATEGSTSPGRSPHVGRAAAAGGAFAAAAGAAAVLVWRHSKAVV